MNCKHCGTELDTMDGRLIDARSGDIGGTYDYCPANPVGDEDERLHEVDVPVDGADPAVLDAMLAAGDFAP